MKNFIQNVSKIDIIDGNHLDPGSNSMLIQIMDPAEGFPVPKYKSFKEIHQFEFLDIEGSGYTNLGDGEFTDMSEFAITTQQGKELAQLLMKAKSQNMNIIVHCYAGIFRSGAVAEVGVMLGFEDTGVFRSPNRLVKHKIMDALNLKYNPKEPMTINGNPCENYSSKNAIMFQGYRSKLDKKYQS